MVVRQNFLSTRHEGLGDQFIECLSA